MAEGELVRARQALAEGKRSEGRAHAERALQLARDAAAPPTVGRALLLLGDVEGDLVRLEQAAAIFEALDEHAGAVSAHLRLAELLLEGGFAARALPHLDEASRRETRLGGDEAGAHAPLTARRHHLRAVALRALGRAHEAVAPERQASLALTLVPDGELLELRHAVAVARAADASATGRLEEALSWHARASDLARRLEDRPAELRAVRALAADLAALGRLDDALRHHRHALDIAREIEDRDAAASVARQALALLDAFGPEDARRAQFEAELEPAPPR